MFDIGAEATDGNADVGAFKFAENAREREEAEGFFEGYRCQRLAFEQGGEAGLFVAFGIADLNQGAEAADFNADRFAALGVGSENAFADLVFEADVERGFDLGVEAVVEVADFGMPFGFAFGDFVEFFFNRGSEVIVENVREVFGQEVVDNDAGIGRNEFAAVAAGVFALGRCGDFSVGGIEAENREADFLGRGFAAGGARWRSCRPARECRRWQWRAGRSRSRRLPSGRRIPPGKRADSRRSE